VKKALVCGFAVLAFVAGACGGDDGGEEETTAPAAEEEATEEEAPEEEAGGAGAVTAANFAFDPPELTAAAGDSIEFTNEDDTVHSFTIDDSDVDEDAQGGASKTIDLSSLDAGSYDFYCKYHDSMTGTLEITG
jgi:plastocyanin